MNDVNAHDRKLRICLIGDAWSIHTRRWARWLRSNGHYVAILSTTNIDGSGTKEIFKDDYDYQITAKLRDGPMGYLAAVVMVRSVAKDLKIDVVHGLYLTSGGFLAALSGHKNKVVSAWGSDINRDMKDGKIKRFMVRYALKHSKMVFASSIALSESVRALGLKDDIRIIRFGPNMEKFRPQGIRHYEKFTYLSIRKPEPIYRQEAIVEAFENIASGLDARLLVQRPSSKNNDLFMRIMNSPMKEKIGFWDERDHDDMPELYGAAHVGISVPESDGFSSAVVECMACGTPVIMPHEGDTELVNPDISVRDGRSLEDAMRKAHRLWSEDNHQWTEQRHRARMTAELYGNFDINMQKAEAAYYEMVG